MCLFLFPTFINLKLPRRISANTLHAVNLIDIFEVSVRKRVAGFHERLKYSNNSHIFVLITNGK